MADISPELLAQLMAISQAPDDEARALLAPMLADFHPLPNRHWREFRARSLVATLLLNAGLPAEALQIAMPAYAADPGDELALSVIKDGRHMFYGSGMRALHHKRPDQARVFFNANIRAFGPMLDVSFERSILDLMEFVDDISRPAPPGIPPAGRPTVVSLGTWGERYIAAAEKTYLPCCLAPGNFPALRQHGTIYLRIHTAEADVERVRRLPVIQELSAHAYIDVSPLPEKVLGGNALQGRNFWNRLVFSAYSHADLMFARNIGADIIMGGGDWLVANKCLSTAKQRLLDGYVAVVVQPIRSVASQIEAIVAAKGCRTGNCLDIPSDLLYRASVEAIHPAISASFMRRQPTLLPFDPIQFCFPTENGFALRSLQMSILAASTRHIPADLRCDFHTYDARLLSDLLVGLDRAKACYVHTHMPGELNYTALDEAEGVATFGAFELSPVGAVASIAKWMGRYEDLDHFIWAVQQRFEYPVPPGMSFAPPPDCRDEDEAVAEIVRLLQVNRDFFFESVRQFAT